jgi:tight adherence protein B
MKMQTLVLAFMAATAIGGVAWVFLYPLLSGERAAEQRRASFARSQPVARGAEQRQQRSRRQQVEESLKDVENRNKKAKTVALATRIAQAGLSWSKQTFIIISVVVGVVLFLGSLLAGAPLVAALLFSFAGGFGLPRWYLSRRKKKREAKFLDAFPDAVDVIVRGLKAGLPLFDSIRVAANDSPDPVGGEFAAIVETQAVGMPLGDACARMYERMPVSEANFFAIVIAIQQKAGGNLSEALGNLSKVLRDRKKMKAKIKALSMEAKVSASIIGAMPPLVVSLVYMMNPNYIAMLWTTDLGQIMLGFSAVWMFIGIMVMRKMINFDF